MRGIQEIGGEKRKKNSNLKGKGGHIKTLSSLLLFSSYSLFLLLTSFFFNRKFSLSSPFTQRIVCDLSLSKNLEKKEAGEMKRIYLCERARVCACVVCVCVFENEGGGLDIQEREMRTHQTYKLSTASLCPPLSPLVLL